MIKYKSIRDPILYLVDEHFKNKQFTKAQRDAQKEKSENIDSLPTRDNLPQYPQLFIRNEEGVYVQVIYGNYEFLGMDVEVDIRIWREEFIYDEEGDCIEIKTTYPDGEESSEYIRYDDKKEVIEITQVEVNLT